MVNNHLYGKVLFRLFDTHIGVFSIHFHPDGTIREYSMTAMDPLNSSVPLQSKEGWRFPYSRTMSCTGDTCTFYISMMGSPTEVIRKQAAKGMDFYGGSNPLFSLMEWTCMRLAKSGKQALGSLHTTNSGTVSDISVRYTSRDTMVFGGPFIDYRPIRVDASGRILSTDGTGTPYNFIVTKHQPIDVDQLAKRMAKSPGIGFPSPRDTIRATIQNSRIEIDYGRPFKRGRKIFGSVIPYDSVWRTGANAATVLTLQNGIRIGKTIIPKGKYSLYTIPRRDSWLLIFNTDTTTWPTDPNRSKEVAQIPLHIRTLTTPKEQFTIDIQETKKGGILKLQWDITEAYTTFDIIK
ncbi:hypothetical protein GCM10023189_20110 [Nibrella saemangeumensis]|uniref:DUF2911 domain-containing protein n=2 Tax=Nibrella saemangeumensis TaxID=1084526 RepID=A0ABP8MTD5_9BACT